MRSFLFWLLMGAIFCGVKAYRNGNSDNGIVPATPRIPSIYSVPAAQSVAVPLPDLKSVLPPKVELPKVELPKVELPKLELSEKLELPPIPDIDSLKAEIEATKFRLPELELNISSEK